MGVAHGCLFGWMDRQGRRIRVHMLTMVPSSLFEQSGEATVGIIRRPTRHQSRKKNANEAKLHSFGVKTTFVARLPGFFGANLELFCESRITQAERDRAKGWY